MIDAIRIKEAENNFRSYLTEHLLKKEQNDTAKQMYLHNATLSLKVAQKLITDDDRPYLWVVVISYYSMFYMANAVLLHMGYKVGSRIAHKVTCDALIVLVLNKLRKELLEEYETIQEEALEVSSVQADDIIQSYDFERIKRSRFQYDMGEEIKGNKARTSLERAKEFLFEMRKLIDH